ncbi:MAG: Hpt domain-containing protein, partial [Gammaproteobacteria bacterium]|nr:Hpt domain-containing protein [Gammaproteobacteria bacterium]
QLGYPVSGEYSIASSAVSDTAVEENIFEETSTDEDIEFDFSEEPELSVDVEVQNATEEPVAAAEVDHAIDEMLLAEGPDDEYLDEDIDEEILEIFVEEADEVLGTMTDCLHAWRADNGDQKSLETLRRSYHTLKGSGRLAGAMVMGEFAWAMESMLNRVMEGKVETSPSMFKLMDQAEVTLNKLLAHLKGETDQRPPVKRLQNLGIAFGDGKEFSVSEVLPDVAVEVSGADEIESIESGSIEFEVEEPEIELADPGEDVDISFESLDESSESEAAPSFDPVLAQVFRKETVTHLAALNEYLSEFSEADAAPVNDAVHRALHTLHGSARMAGVFSIADISE